MVTVVSMVTVARALECRVSLSSLSVKNYLFSSVSVEPITHPPIAVTRAAAAADPSWPRELLCRMQLPCLLLVAVVVVVITMSMDLGKMVWFPRLVVPPLVTRPSLETTVPVDPQTVLQQVQVVEQVSLEMVGARTRTSKKFPSPSVTAVLVVKVV